jgi:3-oxo-5-alpha-steroid 4-dehydrogenase 1
MSPPDFAAYALMALAVPIAAWLWVRPAPYGRHSVAGWGPRLDARLAWVVMESPAALVFAAGLVGVTLGPGAWACAAAWLLHYVQRAFIYPFRMRAPRPMPAAVVMMGATFNGINAWANAQALTATPAVDGWLAVGLLIFLAGFVLNRWSDAVLLRLRDRGPGYHLPVGGAYRWISCPNYLGELVAWAGYALAARSLPALAFFVFTAANLVPRARMHHAWYRATFADMPPERRALVPGVW